MVASNPSSCPSGHVVGVALIQEPTLLRIAPHHLVNQLLL